MDKVYFQSTRDTPDHEEVYVVNADGSNLQRITTTPQSATPGDPARSSHLADVSSDGRSVVFSSNRDGGTSELYLVAADGSNMRQIPISPPGDKLEPNLSVDGKRVVFELKTTLNGIDNYDIYVANLDGSSLQNLTNEPAGDIDPYWSPDGRQVVFGSDREDSDMEIWVMNADGSNKRRLTRSPGFDAEPAWSPDSKHIAFESNRADSNGFDIYVMDPSGNNVTQVVSESTDDFDPAWARSSQQIAFTAGSGSTFDVEVVGLDGSFENLTNGQGSSGKPAWSPKRDFLQP
jgi:TolB protein